MIAPRRFLPSIASLRALEALDRLGSASAVATELALTQSAISRQLQTLERQLGTDLVLRERKRLSLTPAARDYVTDIRQALTLIANASLHLQVAPIGGSLNLAILPAFGMRWLMPRLPDFARRHPDVTLNMSTRLEPFDFTRDRFDAAIHFGHADWPGTDHMLLRHEQVIPVCAPELAPQSPPQIPMSPQKILSLPLLHIQTRPKAWQSWLAHHGISLKQPLSGTMYDQYATITHAAIHGLGVALMPDYLVEHDLAAGRLIALSPSPTEAEGAYYLVWPTSKSNDVSLSHFRTWLATQAQPEDLLPR